MTRSLALVAALALTFVLGSASAPAQTTAETSAADGNLNGLDLAGAQDAARAAIDLQRVSGRLVDVERRLSDADQDVFSTTASLNVTIGLLTLNREQLKEVEGRVRERGVAAYTNYGPGATAPLDVDNTMDLAAARSYSAVAVSVDTENLRYLRALDAKLTEEQATKRRAHEDAVATRDSIRAEQADLLASRDELQGTLSRLGAVPVMGASALSGAQLAAWYRSTGAVPHLATGVTIDAVANLYIEEGAAEGVRGDIAFAQAVIETGSFRVAAGNNFSGIGVCDSCSGGYAFVDPREGVRAQIQLLRNYADPSSRAANLAHAPSPSLYGLDPVHAADLYDTFFLKGKAPLWNEMGNGNWATDPVYAPKVIGLYARMVSWSQAHDVHEVAP